MFQYVYLEDFDVKHRTTSTFCSGENFALRWSAQENVTRLGLVAFVVILARQKL